MFAQKVLAVGKPTVIVLINGGMVAIDDLIEPAPAIIEAFYPSSILIDFVNISIYVLF